MTDDPDKSGKNDDQPSYGFRPSLLGAAWQFRLAPGGLDWELGRRSGHIPYAQVRKLRMSYRPTTMQTQCFITEVWPPSGPKLTIASTTWKSMVEQQRQDQPYRDFVVELHKRIARSGGRPDCLSGASPFLYWPGLAVFSAAALGFIALIVRALQTQALAGALFIAAFLALFLWQLGGYFYRNRPARYRSDALPPALLPKA